MKEEAQKKEDACWGNDEEMDVVDRPTAGQKLDEEDLLMIQ